MKDSTRKLIARLHRRHKWGRQRGTMMRAKWGGILAKTLWAERGRGGLNYPSQKKGGA